MKFDELGTSVADTGMASMLEAAGPIIPDLIIPQEGDTIEIPLTEELSLGDFTIPAGTRIQCALQAGPRHGRWTGTNWIFEVAVRERVSQAPSLLWITAVIPRVWEKVVDAE